MDSDLFVVEFLAKALARMAKVLFFVTLLLLVGNLKVR